MTGCRHHDMLNLAGLTGGRIFVDPEQIAGIEAVGPLGGPGDDYQQPAGTRILLAADCVYVQETPEEVMVLRRHVLGVRRDPAEPRVAEGRRIMPPSERLDWQYPDVVKTTDIGPVTAVNGGAP